MRYWQMPDGKIFLMALTLDGVSKLIAAVDLSGGWRPGIGDPTPIGWLTVAAYFVAAWLCWRTGQQETRLKRNGLSGLRPRFWYFLSAVLCLLGVNKQLDLQ